MMTDYCCAQLKDAAKAEEIVVRDGKLFVNGCCGGGCFVLRDLPFCPFCGSLVSNEKARHGVNRAGK